MLESPAVSTAHCVRAQGCVFMRACPCVRRAACYCVRRTSKVHPLLPPSIHLTSPLLSHPLSSSRTRHKASSSPLFSIIYPYLTVGAKSSSILLQVHFVTRRKYSTLHSLPSLSPFSLYIFDWITLNCSTREEIIPSCH